MEVYTAKISDHFSAAHFIPDYNGCCKDLHGHNWVVEVAISSSTLDNIGLSIDLRTIKKELKSILNSLDHTFLNENPVLQKQPPTAEVVARYVYNRLEVSFESFKIEYVEVFENDNASIRYERR